MKSHTENYKNLEKHYENTAYYRIAISKLIFRIGLFGAFFILFLALAIEIQNFLVFIFIVGIMSFIFYLFIYKETYQAWILKTPKRLSLQNDVLYIQTVEDTYKINLQDIKMLGRGPYWFIEMKDGTQYIFIVHHSITDDILKIWKNMYKNNH